MVQLPHPLAIDFEFYEMYLGLNTRKCLFRQIHDECIFFLKVLRSSVKDAFQLNILNQINEMSCTCLQYKLVSDWKSRKSRLELVVIPNDSVFLFSQFKVVVVRISKCLHVLAVFPLTIVSLCNLCPASNLGLPLSTLSYYLHVVN